MRHPSLLALASSALAVACASPIEGPSTAAEPALAPLGEAAAGADAADRACQVVLRSVGRTPAGADLETECDAAGCGYVWRGSIDVSADALVASVHVLYHRRACPAWWSVAASPAVAATPGFARWDFAIAEHLFGPGDAEEPIELVAFAAGADGGRLFDHNRYPRDLDNLVLDASTGFAGTDGGVCAPTVGTLDFHADYTESRHGVLRRGGWLEIRYDIDRLTACRGTHNGHPAWDVRAMGRFLPGGQPIDGSVRELVSPYGRPTNEAVDRALVVRVPDDADAVELWFRNSTGAGSSCEAWDSDYGADYRFEVERAADDPRCLDVERETGVRGEDPRMVHHAPACLGYDLALQRDASGCGLVVRGFGRGLLGHYGIPYHWLVAHLRVGELGGEVLGVGVWARFVDRATGEAGERFVLGAEIEPGLWQAGVAHRIASFGGAAGRDWSVEEVAFFADVRAADGRVERVWNSRGGANYDVAAAMSLAPTVQSIPYGRIEWANDASEILATRAACGW